MAVQAKVKIQSRDESENYFPTDSHMEVSPENGEESKITVRDLSLYYGKFHALKSINMDIKKNQITALIGPSGCGKSSYLRCLNRMNDIIPGAKTTGSICMDGTNIYQKCTDVVQLRKKVGMVFQKPNPFPVSIYDNVAYGPRIHGYALSQP